METVITDIHSQLVGKARENDRSAQFELYKLYSRAMLNVSSRIIGDVVEAEDVLQESFVSAFKNIKSYRGDATFGAWLKRIVVNKAINAVKKKKVDFTDLGEHDVVEEAVLDEGNYTLEVSMVKEAMSFLPNGFRMVLSLYLFEGYDHKEIGQILNVSESTSKSQYNRAKKKMKLILKERYSYER